jgi:hypothetical protein
VEVDVTDRAAFSGTEWSLLVELPRWVAQAASAAEANNARQSAAEEEAGLLAIAEGRRSASVFVAALAHDLIEIYDEPTSSSRAAAIDFHDPAGGIATLLDRVRTAGELLTSKADVDDAGAYRTWLLAITDTVIGTVRSGTVLGLGGEVVSPAERRFRDTLRHTLYP